MSMKEHMQMEPQKIGDNLYEPSKFALKAGVPDKVKYTKDESGAKYTGDKKILVIAVEQNELVCGNGKKFSTGNNPIETFVPLAHLDDAGFEFDVATMMGNPQQYENWYMPKDHSAIDPVMKKLKPKTDKPMTFDEALKRMQNNEYLGVFIPGGHGALIHLPECPKLAPVLKEAHSQDLFFILICHGPAALLSVRKGETDETFLFRDIDIVSFPDGGDKQAPKIGYLPGPVPFLFNQHLEWMGVNVLNRLMRGQVHVDDKYISGDGPPAADKLGQTAVKTILKDIGQSSEAHAKQAEHA